MFAVIILLLFLLGFWAFIVWDRKRLSEAKVTPISRETMNKGFIPSGVLAWHVYLAVGGLFALLAFTEWQTPSHPPFSGRWSGIKTIVLQVLGAEGLVISYAAMALFTISYGLVLMWKNKQ